MKSFLVSVLIIAILVPLLYSQNPGTTGSYGIFHTYQSRSFQPGRYEVYTNVNFYSKSHAWLWAGNVAVTAGIFDNMDLAVTWRVYQTTNFYEGTNAPHDLFFTLKGGNFTFQKGRYVLAIMGQGRIPIGKTHNYPFTEYASGSFELGIKGGFSYYSNPYLPHRSVSVHYNIGYWNHNEQGKEIPLPDDTKIYRYKKFVKTGYGFSNYYSAFQLY